MNVSLRISRFCADLSTGVEGFYVYETCSSLNPCANPLKFHHRGELFPMVTCAKHQWIPTGDHRGAGSRQPPSVVTCANRVNSNLPKTGWNLSERSSSKRTELR